MEEILQSLDSTPDDPAEDLTELRMFWSCAAPGIASDPLEWWKGYKEKFPILARLARRYLCIPATSGPVEGVWSDAGNIVTKKRNRLLTEHVEKLVFAFENLEYL